MKRNIDKRVRVEVSEKTLLRLLTGGHACAAEFRCMDCESKQCLLRLCTRSCANPADRDFESLFSQKLAGRVCSACCAANIGLKD